VNVTPSENLANFLKPRFGREIHVGPWMTISQDRIDRFAEVTGDIQWIHTDPERAAKESPYGATIAHGYLTLSLLPFLTQSNHPDFFEKRHEDAGQLWVEQGKIPLARDCRVQDKGKNGLAIR